MSGWELLTYGAICATGVLLYLKLVTDDIVLAVEALRRLQRQQHKEYLHRLEQQEKEVITVEAEKAA